MRTPRQKKLIRDYWLLGGSGAVLLGSGLAVLSVGSKRREQAKPYFWLSTGAYALIMSGLSLIGNANRYRTLADVLQELDKRN